MEPGPETDLRCAERPGPRRRRAEGRGGPGRGFNVHALKPRFIYLIERLIQDWFSGYRRTKFYPKSRHKLCWNYLVPGTGQRGGG